MHIILHVILLFELSNIHIIYFPIKNTYTYVIFFTNKFPIAQVVLQRVTLSFLAYAGGGLLIFILTHRVYTLQMK